MRLNVIAITLLASAAVIPAADVKTPDTIDATAAFSRLKSLAGNWEASGPMGKMTINMEVIAGGSAVVEREHHDGGGEMLTVYHMDGKRLMLTHYCLAGNQPRMEASAYDPATGRLQFRFVDITNLSGPTASYMRSSNMRLIDDKHMTASWEFIRDGKSESHDFTYTRVK